MIRAGSRIVGIDDSPFAARGGAARPRTRVLVIGVLMRGHDRVDGILSTHVVRDGFGATAALARMLTTGRLAGQAQAVLLDGIALGGFNVIDLPRLSASVGVPVIAVMRRLPNLRAVRAAMARTSSPERRWRTVQRAGPILRAGRLWFQAAGLSPEQARMILAVAAREGGYPEALRLAHLIGGGVVNGTSRGGA